MDTFARFTKKYMFLGMQENIIKQVKSIISILVV